MARRKVTTGAGATPATRALEAAGVPYDALPYEVDAAAVQASTLGEAAAAELGVPPESVFKTLIALADDAPVCAIVPVTGELALKRLAAAAGAKRAALAPAADAERLTGYVVGGVSPLGQARALPTFLDARALEQREVHVSAGRRGLQLRLAPADLARLTGARSVEGLGS